MNWIKESILPIEKVAISLLPTFLFLQDHLLTKYVIFFSLIQVYKYSVDRIGISRLCYVPIAIGILTVIYSTIQIALYDYFPPLLLNSLNFLFIPAIVFNAFNDRKKDKIELLLKSLLITTLFFIFYAEIFNIVSLLKTDGSLKRIFHWGWSYTNLTSTLYINGVYLLSLIQIVALYCLYKIKQDQRYFLAYSCTLAVLSFFILHMSIKTGIIFLIMDCAILFYLLLRQKKLISLILASIVLLLVIANISKFNYLLQRIDFDPSHQESRITRWEALVSNMDSRSLVFGKGLGEDLYEHYEDSYAKANQNIALKNKYNAHNQFLQYFIEFGILGLLAILYVLIVIIYIPIKIKSPHLLFISLSFVLILSVESFLNRNKGAVIFCIYYGLMMVLEVSTHNNKENSK